METLSDYPLATRIGRLGTETAYAVALEAQKLASTGANVYPFHIGDLNFTTPKCVSDACYKAINEGKTGYPPAAGISELRETLADFVSKERGVEYKAENVVIQSGGKPVIMKFLMALMNKGDEVAYPNPGYPIYESVINFFGGIPKPYSFLETDSGFKLDMKGLKAAITPKTKLLIYNNYNNPTGIASSEEEMKEIAELCIENNLLVLSDEPYFHILFDDLKGKSIVSLPGMLERTVILFSFSKSWAMTGWRVGAFIGPKWLTDVAAKITTNDEACCTHFIQYGAVAALKNPEAAEFVPNMVMELKKRRDCMVDVINGVKGFKTYAPQSTFYLWVNATEAMKSLGMDSYEDFRREVLAKTGVSFCTKEHFGSPLEGETEKYVRFAFSGVNIEIIEKAGVALRDFFGGSS